VTGQARAKPIDREHINQRHGMLFARDAVAVPHLFLSFDRQAATGQFTHSRQAGRGVRRGTPDTLLIAADCRRLWCEWKAPGKKIEEGGDQQLMGAKLIGLGDAWGWVNSCEGYLLLMLAEGIPLQNNAAYLAMYYDGIVASLIAKAEAKRGDAPKSYKAPPKAKPRYTATGKRAGRMAGVGR